MNYLPEGVKPKLASDSHYKKIEVDLGHGLKTTLMCCKKCGNFVGLVRVHEDWHKKNG